MIADDTSANKALARIVADMLYPGKPSLNGAAYEAAYRALSIRSAAQLLGAESALTRHLAENERWHDHGTRPVIDEMPA